MKYNQGHEYFSYATKHATIHTLRHVNVVYYNCSHICISIVFPIIFCSLTNSHWLASLRLGFPSWFISGIGQRIMDETVWRSTFCAHVGLGIRVAHAVLRENGNNEAREGNSKRL
jgi:hypothetical protein